MVTRTKGKTAGLRTLFIVIAALVVGGLLVLALAWKYSKDELTHHLLRDLGIACLISALVTVAYEAYIRYRFDIEKIDTLLNTVYGSSIPLEVWNSIKDTLLSRPVLRQDATFHLRLDPHPNKGDIIILDLQFGYTLVKLGGGKQQAVTHYLDAHICDTELRLPRFITASLGSEVFDINTGGAWKTENDAAWVTESGCLTIKLRPPDSMLPETPVAVRRKEIRNVPGSYFFVMTEVTSGLRVHLEECPSTLDVYLAFWPPIPEVNLGDTRYALFRQTFLPGHALEFKLIRRATPRAETAVSPMPSPSTAADERLGSLP